jgi:hypothetical protein
MLKSVSKAIALLAIYKRILDAETFKWIILGGISHVTLEW